MKKYTFLSFVLVLCFITISLPTFSDDKAPAGLYGYGTLNSEDVPLMQAIEKADLALVKKLIGEGTSIDVQLFNGMKPIHQAAATGQADIAQYLLEQGADVNSRMINDISPLFIAVESQHPDVLKVLLSKGAQYSGREIQLAIVSDDLDMLKLLVTTPELANLSGHKGASLLHSAAMSGKPAIAQYLIDQGAKVDAKTDDGETPLDMATRNKEHLSDLIARGVSKEQILQQGFNYDGYDAVISILNKYKDKH